MHPGIVKSSIEISLPEIVDEKDTIQDIVINGNIAWVFTEKLILQRSISEKEWIKEKGEGEKPIWKRPNKNNLTRIVV
jgi:hypothetical protein